jgi:hypothetical protein
MLSGESHLNALGGVLSTLDGQASRLTEENKKLTVALQQEKGHCQVAGRDHKILWCVRQSSLLPVVVWQINLTVPIAATLRDRLTPRPMSQNPPAR